jgi:hypothetical protein
MAFLDRIKGRTSLFGAMRKARGVQPVDTEDRALDIFDERRLKPIKSHSLNDLEREDLAMIARIRDSLYAES